MRTLIQSAIPVSPRPGPSVDVLIEDRVIVRVQPHQSDCGGDASSIDEVIHAAGGILLPGFVNAHVHTHDRFDLGRYDATPLEVWRNCYNPRRAGRSWTPAETYARTLLAGVEMVRGGIVSVIDDVHLGDSFGLENASAVLDAYRELGIRALVGFAFSDLPWEADLPYADRYVPQQLRGAAATTEEKERALALWEELAISHPANVCVSISAAQRCSREFLERAAQLAAQYQLPILTHLYETPSETLAAELAGRDQSLALLDATGLLTDRTILFHGVHTTAEDRALIADRGARLVHCPGSNAKLGSGVAPIRSMMDAGIPVGLGTDNFSTSDGASMFENMKLAALLSRVDSARPVHPSRWLTAGDVIDMAATGQHKTFLQPGRSADLVLLDAAAVSFVPLHSPLNQSVFAASGADVRTVIANGRTVVRDRVVTTINEDRLRRRVEAMLPEVVKKIALADEFGRVLEPHLTAAFEAAFTALHGERQNQSNEMEIR